MQFAGINCPLYGDKKVWKNLGWRDRQPWALGGKAGVYAPNHQAENDFCLPTRCDQNAVEKFLFRQIFFEVKHEKNEAKLQKNINGINLAYAVATKNLKKGLKNLKNTSPLFKKFEGKLTNKKAILDYLKLDEEFAKIFEPTFLYIHMKRDEQLDNNQSNKLYQKLVNFNTKFSTETSLLSTQLKKLPDKLLDEIISDKKFKDYKRDFEWIKKTKVHNLNR